MCGRRFGKTTIAIDLTKGAAGPMGEHVAYCVPTYKYFEDVWRKMVAMYAPLIDARIAKPNKTDKTISFPYCGGLIEAWSLDSQDPGRGRAYDKVILDEAGIIPGLMNVWREALRPTLLDRKGYAYFFGTPKLVCQDFPLLFKMGQDQAKNPMWKSFSGKSVDNPFNDPAEIEDARRSMPLWQFQQEYEGIPGEVLTAFFARQMLDDLRASCVVDPRFTGSIEIKGETFEAMEYAVSRQNVSAVKLTRDERGHLLTWGFEGRPDQTHAYTIGVDVSAGVGASNTTMCVLDADTGEQVAEYADSRVLPERAALAAAALGMWIGGRDGPATINPEANGGHGETFVQTLLRLGYPAVAKRRRRGVTYSSDTSMREYGFWTDQISKEAVLSSLRVAMSNGRCVLHSAKMLNECETYHYDKGRVVSMEISDDQTEDAGQPGAPHGDRVIAAALAWDAARYESPVVLETRPNPRQDVLDMMEGKKKRA